MGAYQAFRVPDLNASVLSAVEILILLESPHAKELASGRPVSGQAGADALRFLKPATGTAQALGPFVDSLHAKGDGRIAIMNVSEVPLQAQAFAARASPTGLASADWDLLERVRSRRAKYVERIRDAETRDTSAFLLPGFGSRVDMVHFSAGATVVPAGGFAQRYWNSLANTPSVTVLPVLHPSRRQWDRAAFMNLKKLLELRDLFAKHTS